MISQSRHVLVHKRWRTMHELRSDGTARCGGDYHGGPKYLYVQANQVRGNSRPCQTRACEIGREL